jgi:hypothetical protein
MPDGRISQVRFESLAFLPWSYPASERLKRWFAYTPTLRGLPTVSLHHMCRLNAGSESDRRTDDGTAKCPESLIVDPKGRGSIEGFPQ